MKKCLKVEKNWFWDHNLRTKITGNEVHSGSNRSAPDRAACAGPCRAPGAPRAASAARRLWSFATVVSGTHTDGLQPKMDRFEVQENFPSFNVPLTAGTEPGTVATGTTGVGRAKIFCTGRVVVEPVFGCTNESDWKFATTGAGSTIFIADWNMVSARIRFSSRLYFSKKGLLAKISIKTMILYKLPKYFLTIMLTRRRFPGRKIGCKHSPTCSRLLIGQTTVVAVLWNRTCTQNKWNKISWWTKI